MDVDSPPTDQKKENVDDAIKMHFEDLRARGLDASECTASAIRLACASAPRLDKYAAQLLESRMEEKDALGQPFLGTGGPCGILGLAFLKPVESASESRDADGAPAPGPILDTHALKQFYSAVNTRGDETKMWLLKRMDEFLSEALEASGRDKSWDACPVSKISILLLILLNPLLIETEHYGVLQHLISVVTSVRPPSSQLLVSMLSRFGQEEMEQAVQVLQQFIVISLFESNQVTPHVQNAVKFLAILFEANERSGVLPHSSFYNDVVNNDGINIKEDFDRWRHPERFGFSFCKYPFLLDPATKARILNLSSQMEMAREFQDALLQNIFGGNFLGIGVGISLPFNVLRVRRDHIVEDAIAHIQRNPEDLKKPLKVHFEGEEGVDEGGVQKEFFQLIVRDLFDPKYGMFRYSEATRLFWFNSTWLEMEREYELVGSVLGLALYNGHILEAQFPPVVYKKLLGKRPSFSDLKEVDPDLHKGLQSLLAFSGDVEEVYARSFRLDVEDMYGEIVHVDLKEGGADTPVTSQNRQEFVDLCVKYYLEDSIVRQFAAFARGFQFLCGGPALHMFQPEELELAICGSPVLNFSDLEKNARYEDGYTKDSPTIIHFWKIVHKLPEEQKKSLLAFVTGSDRAPIRGLGELPFIISRNGPDSNRLPTAHTCFNHLLLPEYSSPEKLEELLIKAIRNSMGFGLM